MQEVYGTNTKTGELTLTNTKEGTCLGDIAASSSIKVASIIYDSYDNEVAINLETLMF